MGAGYPRNDTLQGVRWGGPMWASAPTDALQGVRYRGPSGTLAPTERFVGADDPVRPAR